MLYNINCGTDHPSILASSIVVYFNSKYAIHILSSLYNINPLILLLAHIYHYAPHIFTSLYLSAYLLTSSIVKDDA